MKNIKNKYISYFIYSAIATSLIIILFCGMIIADKNTRQIAFNDYSSIIDINIIKESRHYLGIKTFGKPHIFDISFFYSTLQTIKNIINWTINTANTLLNIIPLKQDIKV